MRRRLSMLSLAAATLLAGCVVAPYPAGDAYYGEPVTVAPPAPRVEYVGAPPVVGQVWIGGYWNWLGGHRQYQWVPGYWTAPRPGRTWVPHRWDHDGRQWRPGGGYWQGRGDRAPGRRGAYRR